MLRRSQHKVRFAAVHVTVPTVHRMQEQDHEGTRDKSQSWILDMVPPLLLFLGEGTEVAPVACWGTWRLCSLV